MAAKTTLNAKNLESLGAERLAALVMDIVQGDAARKRVARAALLEAAGGSALAAEVSKRLIALRRARSWIDYGKRRAFLDDLNRQRDAIATRIAPEKPKDALDLMWRFMALAEPIYQRIDDSSGAVGDIFRQACLDLGAIALKAKPKPATLADDVARALVDANGFGEFDALIAASAPALGKTGLARLKQILLQAEETEAKKSKPTERRIIGIGLHGALYEDDLRARHVRSAVQLALLEIADATGDVDGYIAAHPEGQRTNTVFAARIAERLVAASRAEEALGFLDAAKPTRDFGRSEWTQARLGVFDALGRQAQAQTLRWETFQRDLDPDMLRAHLKLLPDFEDIEAEEKALCHVERHEDVHAAMLFLIEWSALDRAAALILERPDELDGDLYYILSPAADALESTQPLAATVLLRAMISFTLGRTKSSRYKHAARHLHDCEHLANAVDGWKGVEPHDPFKARLRKDHPRKAQFWHLFDKD